MNEARQARDRQARSVPAVLGWVVVAISAIVVATRLTHLDAFALLIGAIAFSPWVFVPALAVALVALLRHRRLLTLAAVVVLIAPGWWTVTHLDHVGGGPTAGRSWARLRILDANVTWTNTDMASIPAQIGRDAPDIVALEEVTPSDVKALVASGQFARFPWHIIVPASDSAGMALWSDRPLVDASEWIDAGHPEIRARVLLPGASMSLLVVHTFIPVGLPVNTWKQELAGIAAAARGLHGERMVIGDFNATWDMYEFRRIVDTGLRDAAVATGHPWAMTWSPWSPLPPLLQIDHALVSPGMAVTRYGLGADRGSQHRSLLLTVAVPPGAS